MSIALSDTAPEVEAVQLELLRRMTGAERVGLAARLSSRVMSASKRAIARIRPDLSPREVEYCFIELHYGRELAEAVKECDRVRGHERQR